jgi:hypothetical protein
MIFEYACEVWDNCGVSNSCKLERLQLEAAIIITGLPIFTNTEYLNRETGWERLEETIIIYYIYVPTKFRIN